eukprot:SAG11_NODE_1345_length_5147_cov_3.840729_10_plen_101_part_00
MADGGDGVNARLHDGLDSSISDNSKRPAVAPDGSPARRSLTPAAEPAEAPASPSHQMLRQSIAEMGDAALTELRAVCSRSPTCRRRHARNLPCCAVLGAP